MRSLINAVLLISSLAAPVAGYGASEIRFDVAVLPEFQKHSALFGYPGYSALALENSGLSPSPGSKLMVKEQGRVIATRYSTLRFEGRKGEAYSYEVAVLIGTASIHTRLTFPVVVDVSSLTSGKITVSMKPPFGAFFPDEFKNLLQRKVDTLAPLPTQKQVLAYLDQLTRNSFDSSELNPLTEAILVDAYNNSGGPAAGVYHDTQQPLLTSDKWLLLITFILWLFLLSVLLAVYARRQRHSKSA